MSYYDMMLCGDAMQNIQKIKRAYYGILSLFWFATGLPMAISIIFTQERGMDLYQIGLLMAVYSLTIVLLEVPTGGLADAIGRKRVSLIAYIFLAGSNGLILFSFTFPTIMMAFIMMGIGRALSSGALEAWFVDALQNGDTDVEIQPALAMAGTVTLFSLGLGSIVGSLIPQFINAIPQIQNPILTPLSAPFLLAFITKLFLILSTVYFIDEESTTHNLDQWKRGLQDVPEIIQTGFSLTRHNTTILLLLAATVASGFALTGLESFWQPQLRPLMSGGTENTIYLGIIMAGNFLLGMLGNIISTPIARIFHKRYALVSAIFQGVWGASIITLALQTSLIPAALFFWLAYLNMGIINSPHSTLLNQEIPAKQRSAMLSIASLTGYFGAMLGGVLLGFVAERISISTAWWISGAVVMVSLSFYLFIEARRMSEDKKMEIILTEGFPTDYTGD